MVTCVTSLTEAPLRLKSTLTLVTAAAAGSALVMTGGAFAAPPAVDSATGGGQILFSTDGGAGNTIAFTARGNAQEATGQVQYVNREAGNGQSQEVLHGTVDCIVVDGTIARMSGVWRDGTEFALYVQDNGEGSSAEDDIVAIAPVDDAQCADDPNDDDMTALGRGNAQVRDGDTASDGS